jgi:hypothetical protein
MIDFKNLSKISFHNDSVWLVVFGLLPVILGILAFLGFMLFNELT